MNLVFLFLYFENFFRIQKMNNLKCLQLHFTVNIQVYANDVCVASFLQNARPITQKKSIIFSSSLYY